MSFVEINHEIFSTASLLFRWFKKGSFQLLMKVCAQVMVNHLED